MCCFQSGEVLVLPEEGGPETIDFGGDQYYSADSVIDAYARSEVSSFTVEEAINILRGFRAKPFVLRVEEGSEKETALRLQENPRVRAAIPNYFVQTLGNFVVNPAGIASLQFDSTRLIHGPVDDTRITIIDTGVDSAYLQGQILLEPLQFDVQSPRAGSMPFDDNGHGTVIARIIEHFAPGARIQSIRVMPGGTIAAIVMAIQIAISTFKPHVVNLSLGLAMAMERCPHCKLSTGQQFPEAMIHQFFEHLDTNMFIDPPVYVCAAGNSSAIKLPARCNNTLAVGAYDIATQQRPSYALYPSVPSERFIMAFGGDAWTNFGRTWQGSPFYGTSFAAAIATAVVGPLAAAHRCHLSRRECVMDKLATLATTTISSYTPELHGLGVLA